MDRFIEHKGIAPIGIIKNDTVMLFLAESLMAMAYHKPGNLLFHRYESYFCEPRMLNSRHYFSYLGINHGLIGV